MKTEVLVVGGGLAGSAAAIRLAQGGAQVVLAERERTTGHKVCGEFLSVEALGYLRQLGIDPAALGAVPLRTVRVAGSYGVTEAALPFAAMSLSRRRLDGALLRCAESAGVTVRRGYAVQGLFRAGAGWSAELADGETVSAGAVFQASGKHDLRGRPRPAGRQQGLVAFKMYWQLGPEPRRKLGDAVELVLYQGGYAGLQPVENDAINLSCLIQRQQLRRLGAGWPGLLNHMLQQSPHLRERLAGGEPQLARPLCVASLPYGFVRESTDGLWYVGDQAVVIPSFTGDGMSLALHTAFLAARCFLERKPASHFQGLAARQARRQVAIATAVSRSIVGMPRMCALAVRCWPGVVRTVARQTRIATVA